MAPYLALQAASLWTRLHRSSFPIIHHTQRPAHTTSLKLCICQTASSQPNMAPTKKRSASGIAIPDPLASASSSHALDAMATDPLPIVKVNTANLTEIKAALDDLVKQVRQRAIRSWSMEFGSRKERGSVRCIQKCCKRDSDSSYLP